MSTRQNILVAAETLTLRHGFYATTVDKILEQTGLSKGAFFYHFTNKKALAIALLEKFIGDRQREMGEVAQSCMSADTEPLTGVLGFLDTLADKFDAAIPEGCIVAALTHELSLEDPEIREICAHGFTQWQENMVVLFSMIRQDSQAVQSLDLEELADQFICIMEGAFIVARAHNDPSLLARQIRLYRQQVNVLFAA